MKKDQHIQQRFRQLLEKFQVGKCSLTELYELQSFFEDNQFAPQIKEQMLNELEKGVSDEGSWNSENLLQRLESQIHKNRQQSKQRSISPYWKAAQVAAILVLTFLLGGLTFYFIGNKPAPNDNRNYYSEIVVPLGSKSKVVLPDSSIVWLNAGSKVRYSNDFNKKDRDISLVGEGYFKVAKNKHLPFIVNSTGFLVEAVGTEFNVEAYSEDRTIETILVKGKVKLDHELESIVGDVYMNPNSKATFYKNPNDPAVINGEPRLVIETNIDPMPLISWKDGRYIFKSELLKDLAVKLGRRYNFKFEFESNEVKNYRFSGILKDETLQQVMDVIKTTSPITYEIKGKVVTISKDYNRTRNFEKHLKQ